MLHKFTDANFQSDVLDVKGLVMVDFYASWCGPCQALAPVLEELAQDFDGKASIGKYSVEDDNKFAAEYNVMSIPAVKFFKDGEYVGEIAGLRAKEDYADKLNELLG